MHNKARKGFELAKQAEEYRSRAASVEANDAIFSDNPQAVDLLTEKANELKAEQAEMKRINAALRKGVDFDTLEMSEAHRKDLLDVERFQAYYQPRTKGFPPYMLTSINAKIKTAEKRAEVVEKKQALHDEDFEINGVKIEGRPSENRIRLDYGQRVPAETYRLLKQHGFRQLHDGDGRFSAYYNNNAQYFIKTYIRNK
jgi:small-conductance mechanosensitive channel